MSTRFLKPSHPLLRKKAAEIIESEVSSKKTQQIINRLLKIATGEQKDQQKPIMVGLAAPQIGISKRIILVDVGSDGKGKAGDPRVFINPEIIWESKKKSEWYEGCYSTSRICGIVSRPTAIKIQAFVLQPGRLQAKLKVEKHRGYVARIFQHEIDHLNGKVFVDLITNQDNLHWVLKSEFPIYRNKMAWKTWPRKCSFEKWQNIQKPLA